ncbi:sigma-70 family RNA polymerase sigma factor [Mycolicibacterium sp. S2-37]|nr:sigma-70 family RNA polymerase sigma factor [Mycolicibacterium sp. S2-37]
MKSILAEQETLVRGGEFREQEYTATSFEQMVLPWRAELMRAAIRLTRNAPDAEDLLQETLFRAYRGLSTFEAGTNVRAWLHRILRNVWINTYRARERRPSEVPMEAAVTDRLTDGTAPEETVIAAEPDAEVYRAMAALSEEFRMVVYLADVEGHSCAAIADLMGTPVGTVMSRLHRARGQLRVSLGDTARRRRLVAAA